MTKDALLALKQLIRLEAKAAAMSSGVSGLFNRAGDKKREQQLDEIWDTLIEKLKSD